MDWEGHWLVQFDTPCEWLIDGKCGHYSLRPDICREYDPADCERYNPTPAERILLRNPRDLERYLAEREARLASRSKSRRKPSRKRSLA